MNKINVVDNKIIPFDNTDVIFSILALYSSMYSSLSFIHF